MAARHQRPLQQAGRLAIPPQRAGRAAARPIVSQFCASYGVRRPGAQRFGNGCSGLRSLLASPLKPRSTISRAAASRQPHSPRAREWSPGRDRTKAADSNEKNKHLDISCKGLHAALHTAARHLSLPV